MDLKNRSELVIFETEDKQVATTPKDRKAKGYLAFKPYYIKVTGTLKTYNSAYQNINGGLVQKRSVTARYPKKLSSGVADGCFKVKYYD